MRDLGTIAAAQLAGNYIPLGIFVSMTFVSSVEYVWSGYGDITWNGHTWKGIGDLGSIGTITEDSTLTAQGLTISLSSIRPDLVSEALTEVRQGAPCLIYLVFFDDAGNPIDSVMAYAARMDQPTLEEQPESAKVSITLENRLSDLQRAPYRRLTDQDQRIKYPNDDGLKWVSTLLDWNGSWGAK